MMAFASSTVQAEYSITNPTPTGFTLNVGAFANTATWYYRAWGR